MAFNPEFGSFEDVRDGRVYRTVKLAGKEWFAENLAFKSEGSFAYSNDESFCETYGRLYLYKVLKDVVPIGWHLPTRTEIDELEAFLVENGVKQLHGRALKTADWPAERKIQGGTDAVGFCVKPGGSAYSSNDFRYMGESTGFWIENDLENDDDGFWYWDFDEFPEFRTFRCGSLDGKKYLYYVRLVKNTEQQTALQIADRERRAAAGDRVQKLLALHEADFEKWKADPVFEAGSFTDPRDGRSYRTLKFAGVEWMAENLAFKVPKSVDDPLGNGRQYDWKRMTNLPMTCKYGDYPEDVMQQVHGERFQGISPDGWHLPNKKEVEFLLKCVAAAGYEKREGFALKAKDLFEELASGHKTFDNVPCPVCGGKCVVAGPEHEVVCPECGGTGEKLDCVPMKFVPGGDVFGFGMTPLKGLVPATSFMATAYPSVVLSVDADSDEAKVCRCRDFKDMRFVRCVRNIEV